MKNTKRVSKRRKICNRKYNNMTNKENSIDF